MKKLILILFAMVFVVSIWSFEIGDIITLKSRSMYGNPKYEITQIIERNEFTETEIFVVEIGTNHPIIHAYYRDAEYCCQEMIEKLQKENKLLKEQLDGFMQIKIPNRYKICAEKVLDDMEKATEPSIYLNEKGKEISIAEKRKDKEGYIWMKIKNKNTNQYYWAKEVDLKLIELK